MFKRKLLTGLAGVLAALLLAIPATAGMRDVNDDNLPDRWEKRHDLSLKVKQGKRNQDADGLRNRGEFREGTDPRDADTDNDGETDGEEVEEGSDPCEGKGHHGPKPPPEEGGEEEPPAGE